MTTTASAVETGVLASGHPFVRVGTGSQPVLSIPGLSFTAEAPSRRWAKFLWKSWLPAVEQRDLTVWDIGRRGDFPTGTTTQGIADDYASLIRARFDGPVGVLGTSTGGAYALWLAIRHPELVDRLVLGFTGPRLTPEKASQAHGTSSIPGPATPAVARAMARTSAASSPRTVPAPRPPRE